MSLETVIREAIQTMVSSIVPVLVTDGVVKSVNKNTNTCDVTRDGMPELHDVRLNSVLHAGKDLITIYPTVGSKVLCIMIENQPTDNYLLAASDIERITIEISGIKLDISKDGIIMNDGSLGGLIKIQEMQQQLSIMTARIDGVINALNSAIPASGASDGGAALIASIKGSLAQIIKKEDFSKIEDSKIKH